MEPVRILLIGICGTPLQELGDRLSSFHSLDLYSIEQEPESETSYFADKIKSIPLDAGDWMSGNASQQMSRDFSSARKEKEMDRLRVPLPIDRLSDIEIEQLEMIDEGIISSEIIDYRLANYATHIVFFDADTDKAVEWFKGRSRCLSCKSVYHDKDRPSKIKGICDRCGSDLSFSPEDHPEVIREKYKQWRKLVSRLKTEAVKKMYFMTVRVDLFDTFDDIVLSVDRWLREKIGRTGVSWSARLDI